MGTAIPTVYSVPTERTSPRWSEAFAAGCGGRVQVLGPLRPGPVAVWGSTALWQDVVIQAQAEGRDWYYGDHGYFGRGRYFRITKNAYQHSGIGDPDYRRLAQFHLSIKRWRYSGSHVLVCPPDEVFAGLMGFKAKRWLRDTLSCLKKHTDRPIRVRSREFGDAGDRPLAVDLRDCFALVTYTSNAAVEAVLAGVPVICTGPCAAQTMGLSDPRKIESVVRPPGRVRWIAVLAANQWTLNEIHAGVAWASLSRESG